MAELTRDIAAYLESAGLVAGAGVDVFLDSRPDQPNNLVSIWDTGSYPPEYGISDIKRTVQITVRNTSSALSKSKSWAIFKALDKPENRVVMLNGRKAQIKAMQSPHFLETDASNRTLYVFNLGVTTSRD